MHDYPLDEIYLPKTITRLLATNGFGFLVFLFKIRYTSNNLHLHFECKIIYLVLQIFVSGFYKSLKVICFLGEKTIDQGMPKMIEMVLF